MGISSAPPPTSVKILWGEGGERLRAGGRDRPTDRPTDRRTTDRLTPKAETIAMAVNGQNYSSGTVNF